MKNRLGGNGGKPYKSYPSSIGAARSWLRPFTPKPECATATAIGRACYETGKVCTTARAAPYKPRPRDYRRAEDAPQQLQQRIKATFDALQAMRFDLQRVKWGFSDEVAAQLTANNCRFRAFEPHMSRQVNTDRGSRSFFGFYGINAQSHLVSLSDGKAASIRAALLAVKAQQVGCDALVVFCGAARAGQCEHS